MLADPNPTYSSIMHAITPPFFLSLPSDSSTRRRPRSDRNCFGEVAALKRAPPGYVVIGTVLLVDCWSRTEFAPSLFVRVG